LANINPPNYFFPFTNTFAMNRAKKGYKGKYIISSEGAKSFEAALYLCKYLYGKEIAQSLADGLVIEWDLETIPYLILE